MREKHIVQSSIFEHYPEHEIGLELKSMSGWLDQNLDLLDWVVAYINPKPNKNDGIYRIDPSKMANQVPNMHTRMGFDLTTLSYSLCWPEIELERGIQRPWTRWRHSICGFGHQCKSANKIRWCYS